MSPQHLLHTLEFIFHKINPKPLTSLQYCVKVSPFVLLGSRAMPGRHSAPMRFFFRRSRLEPQEQIKYLFLIDEINCLEHN